MKEQPNLSEAEWKILSTLWEHDFLTITQLVAELKTETNWSKSTVITLLKRMEEKRAVAYIQGERAKKYYALIKRENVAIPETKSFLKRLYNGSLGLMINSMIEQDALTDRERNELYDILKKAEDKKK
ncbi:MAG: BlaI/MecI/CopY family transcriptional regulator [Alistipes sp.]|nr:BlaI/MecI/CopY family transcriptional regulator [Alistipes sp.]